MLSICKSSQLWIYLISVRLVTVLIQQMQVLCDEGNVSENIQQELKWTKFENS